MPEPTPPHPIPRPIADHAAVGDMATLALIATDGTVDFLCWPRFDSPSVFCGLLDPDQGGDFSIAPALDGARQLQTYYPDTNVLLTRWLGEQGSGEVVDAMPILHGLGPRLVRRVTATRGRVTFKVRCRPRFDYARTTAPAIPCDGGVAFDPPGGPRLRLTGTEVVTAVGNDAWAEVTLDQGRSAAFVLDGGDGPAADLATVTGWVDQTVGYWREWSDKSTYAGRWREAVNRSALVMKLLTSREHNSIVAAGTFGLPEAPGGPRNWDYRATWIRDASFTVYAFLRLGYQREAVDFLEWVDARIHGAADRTGRLQIMYGIDGRRELPEQTLTHLAGYGGAGPVRIGNAAHLQVQMDIYGELLDSGYLVNKYAKAVSHDAWQDITRTVDYVCENWRQADQGIWEMRGEPREYLHSRVMCWVALDRAIRLAQKRSLPADLVRWSTIRGQIHDAVWADFYDPKAGHFVQARGSTSLDGSLLMLPLVRFCSATDPRWLATLDAIGEKLVDDGLVFRYVDDDGLAGQEGAFLTCSFWYAECLARAGRLWKARVVFERVLAHANHVGLFAEEVGRSGQFLGNFPQALTHLSLISAAFYLDRELSNRPAADWRP